MESTSSSEDALLVFFSVQYSIPSPYVELYYRYLCSVLRFDTDESLCNTPSFPNLLADYILRYFSSKASLSRSFMSKIILSTH